MKLIKIATLLLACAILMVGVSGCMNEQYGSMKRRQESDEQYAQMILDYIEDKYGREFEIVKYDFPEEGFNDEFLENDLMLRDVQTGVTTYAYSYLGKPYDYFDSFVSDYAGHQEAGKVDTTPLSQYGKAKLYLYLRSEKFHAVDVSPENVSRAVMVVNIPQRPSEEAMQALYQVYQNLQDLEYEKKYLVVGFTDGNQKFDDYVDFYRVYGIKTWTDYGTVYAQMSVKESAMSYEAFCQAIQ